MSNPIATALRAAARAIIAQADAIDAQGATVSTDRPVLIQWGGDLVTLEEAERRRLAEIADSEKPHAYVAPGIGVLHDQAGTGEGAPRSFVTHAALWDAAERGDPVREGGERIFVGGVGAWPGPDGKPFRMDDYKPRGPVAMHRVIEWLWTQSPYGTAWKLSPAVQGQLPKTAEGALADPQLHPITK